MRARLGSMTLKAAAMAALLITARAAVMEPEALQCSMPPPSDEYLNNSMAMLHERGVGPLDRRQSSGVFTVNVYAHVVHMRNHWGASYRGYISV